MGIKKWTLNRHWPVRLDDVTAPDDAANVCMNGWVPAFVRITHSRGHQLITGPDCVIASARPTASADFKVALGGRGLTVVGEAVPTLLVLAVRSPNPGPDGLRLARSLDRGSSAFGSSHMLPTTLPTTFPWRTGRRSSGEPEAVRPRILTRIHWIRTCRAPRPWHSILNKAMAL